MTHRSIRNVVLLAAVAILWVQLPGTSEAFTGDPTYLELPYGEGFAPTALEADNETAQQSAHMAYIVEQAGTIISAAGETLLPAGTRFDRMSRTAGTPAIVELTLPEEAGKLIIDAIQASTIERVLARAFGDDPELAGVVVRLRVGEGPYRDIEEFGPRAADLPPDSEISDDSGLTAKQGQQNRAAAARVETPAVEAIGGPIAHGDGQPQGALSGVVVYISAGHGWTAGASSWYLQRPLLLNMVEDYGNIDQLNSFAHRLYNAGAVVVPYRPVGYQPVEIVLDNDDPGVTFTGSWSNSSTTSGYYENGATTSGVPYRYASASSTETAVARYTPTLPTSGFWPVYCWTKDDTDRVKQTYRIKHSGGTATVVIDHQIVGKGWMWLGEYHFEAGTGGYVEISNQSTQTGVAVADAIRFGNGMGDMIGTGPGTVSGYPREEEASRYWAQSEAGVNAVGLPTSIWSGFTSDANDNVGTAARWSAYMNRQNINDDRWRRAYVEFHTNAAGCASPPCSAKGTVALVNEANPTTNQIQFSTIVGDKIEADMVLIQDQFEYTWGVRSNPYSGAYGAISTNNNDNEFDATLIEVAFHDNTQDTANLRNVKVRDAVARSTLQGLIMFLSNTSTFPGTQVPQVFPPEPPARVQAIHDGQGNVAVSWSAAPSGGANGSPATGYKVYRSPNGYGFGQAVTLGNVLSTTLTDIPAGETVYLRVASFNAGGESMPSEVIAVRRPATGTPSVLIVNGFDRVSRQQNPIQMIPSGAMERQIARKVNSFDYIVQHANALADHDYTFDSCSNEAVIEGNISLTPYVTVVWILGEESSLDHTFDTTERLRVTEYLGNGGTLFVSGSEIAYELDYLNVGRSFYRNVLGAQYVGDDAGSYQVTGQDGILADIGAFNFSPASGAPYDTHYPDRIIPQTGGETNLRYVGGTSDGAGIQYDAGLYRTVVFGFPFETITAAAIRSNIMQKVVSWLQTGLVGCPPTLLANFEQYEPGDRAMFQDPRLSGSTLANLAESPNTALVFATSSFGGSRAINVQWSWIDTTPQRWLRLTTNNVTNQGNPTIDLTRPLRFRMRFTPGSLRVCIGVRETNTDAPLGANGGATGSIEWIGAGGIIDGAPLGKLLSNQGFAWQTVSFVPTAANVLAFTGNGILEGTYGKGVLEHLAFSVVDTQGPLTVNLDLFEQLCPLNADLDDDSDVDLSDFAIWQNCVSGVGVPHRNEACAHVDLDGDADVDTEDLDLLRQCFSGEGVPADPVCLGTSNPE